MIESSNHPPVAGYYSDNVHFREPNVWPSTTATFDGEWFQSVMKRGFDVRMKLSKVVIETLGKIIDSPSFADMFGDSEFTSFYLKKYTERNVK